MMDLSEWAGKIKEHVSEVEEALVNAGFSVQEAREIARMDIICSMIVGDIKLAITHVIEEFKK